MKRIRLIACVLATMLAGTNVCAQVNTDSSADSGLDDLLFLDDEEPQDTLPAHPEYYNQVYLQYSPTRYRFDGATPRLHFEEFAIGYNRSIQVLEKKPYYVELGAQLKYSYSSGDAAHQYATYNLLTFKVPVNLAYKLFIPHTEVSFTPLAGVYFRCSLMGHQDLDGEQINLFDHDITNTTGAEWDRCQLGWQVGLRFQVTRFYVTALYGRDFPDENKLPWVNESSVTIGCCF